MLLYLLKILKSYYFFYLSYKKICLFSAQTICYEIHVISNITKKKFNFVLSVLFEFQVGITCKCIAYRPNPARTIKM